MKNIAIKLFMVSAVIAVSACSSNEDRYFPSVIGTDSQESVRTNGTNVVSSSNTVKGITFVGQKVVAFRKELSQIQDANRSHSEELQKIRANILQNTTQYNNSVSAIETKLQIGTTPGNPNMYASLQQAQNNSQNMAATANALDTLSAKVANNATSTNYLSDSVHSAFGISGAVDEDHRQLRSLQNETEQMAVLINSLTTEISGDIARQQQYLADARVQINRLNNAIKVGNFQGSPVVPTMERPLFTGKPTPVIKHDEQKTDPQRGHRTAMRGKPIFAVKFINDNIDYADGLSRAIESALERKPASTFEVIAVSNGSNPAKDRSYANNVFKSIISSGVNPNNVNIGAKHNPQTAITDVEVYAK